MYVSACMKVKPDSYEIYLGEKGKGFQIPAIHSSCLLTTVASEK